MANRYWVNTAGGSWNATPASNWSTTSGGAGGSAAPTAADDVYIDANSGTATITIPSATTVVCRSLNFVDGTGGAYTGTFALAASTSVITIGDGTAGAGNNALKLSSGMTWTNTGIGTINFVSTSATQQTITTNGKQICAVTINGAGSSYKLGDALTMQNVTGNETLTVSNGTFDTGNFNMNIGIFTSAGSNNRTLTFGSSAVTMNRNGTTMTIVTTNLTITANTSTWTNNNSPTFAMGGANMNGASLTINGGGTVTHNGGATWANVTRTGTASKTDVFNVGTSLTCTGTFTCSGNSTTSRILLASGTPGTSTTITAATVTVSNIDIMDITGAGAGSWNLASITGNSGDCGGNSGITFTTPAAQTFDSTAGNWSTAARWTSRVPLPQDDVTINSSSGNVTLDMPRCGKNTTFSGYTGTATWTTSIGQTFYGSLTMGSGMTNSFGNTVNYVLAGRGTHTFDSAGKNFSGVNMSTTFTAPGGSYTLASAYTTGHSITVSAGTFDTADYTITCSSVNITGAITRTVNLGSSAINLTVTTNTCWTVSGSNYTVNTGTSVLTITNVGTGSRTFGGGNVAYNELVYTVANSTTVVPITGSNTFNKITLAAGHVITFAATTQNNVKEWAGSGANWGYQRLQSQGSNYVSIPDSAALSWTGNFDLRVRLSMDAWNQSNAMLVSKRTTASTGLAWTLAMNSTTKQPQLIVSSSGTAGTAGISTDAVPFSDGSAGWLRATWRASDGRIQFFTSTDSTNDPSVPTWTQLGTDRTAAVGSIFDSPAVITIGTADTAATPNLTANIYRVQARNNILDDGTGIQLDVDFTSKTFGADTFTESSSNAATVTITGDAAQTGDGRIFVKSGTNTSNTYLQMFGAPQAVDYWAFRDIYSVVPRKIFATNSVNTSNNLNIVFSALTSEPYIAWQQNVTGSGSSTAITLPFTPIAGDLLVVGFGNSSNGTGTITPPSGFTLDKGVSATVAMRIYSKISDGTETTLTFTSTLAPAVTTLQAYCIRGFSGTPAVDVTDSNTGTSVTSSSTGSGATNTTTPALALAMIQGSGAMNQTVSATNSFEWVRPLTELTTTRTLVKPLSSTGSNSSTLTWTTARNIDFELVIYKFISSTFTPVVTCIS